jgi:multidrug efflux pump subunit AcrA (membrane-fusion protein)
MSKVIGLDEGRVFRVTLSPCHLVTLSLLLACGCSKPEPAPAPPITLDPAVKLVHAEYRTVKRTVEQPGVINAYERTAVYAKVSGFVKKWNVDIGDRIKKGATLVELEAPELVAQHEQMKAQVVLDEAQVEQSKKQHVVAQRNVLAATEQVAQAQADVKSYEAIVERWESEVKRLTTLVGERVVDQQVLDETRRQLKSSQALLEASRVAVRTRDAQRLAADATQETRRRPRPISPSPRPRCLCRSRRSAAWRRWWPTSRLTRPTTALSWSAMSTSATS